MERTTIPTSKIHCRALACAASRPRHSASSPAGTRSKRPAPSPMLWSVVISWLARSTARAITIGQTAGCPGPAPSGPAGVGRSVSSHFCAPTHYVGQAGGTAAVPGRGAANRICEYQPFGSLMTRSFLSSSNFIKHPLFSALPKSGDSGSSQADRFPPSWAGQLHHGERHSGRAAAAR